MQRSAIDTNRMDHRILNHLLLLCCILICLTDVSSRVTSNYDTHNDSYPITKPGNISANIIPFTTETDILDSSINSPQTSDRPLNVPTESFPTGIFNSNTLFPSDWSKNPNSSSICRLSAKDPAIYESIRTLIVDEQVKLLEYHLFFSNYSVNPLTTISRYAYKLETWARASSRHGQTLLSLAFNYGILSLRTLSFGTDVLVVEMMDIPSGCVIEMNEEQVVDQLLYLLSRDLKDTEEVMLQGEERICHEVIVNVRGYAKFKDQCFKSGTSGELVETDAGNFWINLLYTMLMLVRFGVIFFGPLLLTSAVGKLSRKSIPYVVKLKEALKKKVVLAESYEGLEKIKPDKTVDLRSVKGFPKLRRAVRDLNPTFGQPFDAQITQYDILVSYKRLLTENRVPVGLWRSIGRSIFYCKIRDVEPFRACCEVNMFSRCPCTTRVTRWKYFWRKVGLVLMVICIPFPWYVRLWIFYSYEYAEVLSRKEATEKVGLKENLDNSLIHYFLPEHWIFSLIYILYFASACLLGYMARGSEEGRFRKIIVGSFSDLENLSWFRVLQMLISNVIWPFQKYGVCGLFVAVFYWPIAIPITLIAFVLYSLPLTYLTIRMFFYSRRMFMEKVRKRPGVRTYRDKKHNDETIQQFEASHYFGDGLSTKNGTLGTQQMEDPSIDAEDLDKIKHVDDVKGQPDTFSLASTIVKHAACKPRRFIEHMLSSLLCVLSLFSILLILSECLGCLVEIIVFTMMGIIVNAGTLLKYVSLVILVVVYSYDSFNNVEMKYLKLNKALFNEVKGRIKDLDKVTSLPSNLQENRGFKSQELSEQGTYESPDDIAKKPIRHWFINDLVLFVDNEDMPRIPKKLFDEVCQIKVAGVPGPVYRGLLFGIKQFLKISLFIFFVFVVVLSFGEVYKISSTNQMLAALAGGLLPAILRQFMEPERPDIEIGTVSFKSKLDEIIKNFNQVWPIYDLPLERAPEPEEEPKPDEQEHPQDHSNNECSEKEIRTEIINDVSRIKEDLLNGNMDLIAETSSHEAGLKMDKHVGFEPQSESESVDLLILLPEKQDSNWLDEWSDIVEFQQNDATATPLTHDIETGSQML